MPRLTFPPIDELLTTCVPSPSRCWIFIATLPPISAPIMDTVWPPALVLIETLRTTSLPFIRTSSALLAPLLLTAREPPTNVPFITVSELSPPPVSTVTLPASPMPSRATASSPSPSSILMFLMLEKSSGVAEPLRVVPGPGVIRIQARSSPASSIVNSFDSASPLMVSVPPETVTITLPAGAILSSRRSNSRLGLACELDFLPHITSPPSRLASRTKTHGRDRCCNAAFYARPVVASKWKVRDCNKTTQHTDRARVMERGHAAGRGFGPPRHVKARFDAALPNAADGAKEEGLARGGACDGVRSGRRRGTGCHRGGRGRR